LPEKVESDIDPCERLEPISLELVDKVIDYYFAEKYYMEKYWEDKRSRGDYEERGGHITIRGNNEEMAPYLRKALEHVESGNDRLHTKTSDDFPIKTLLDCVEFLRSIGINEIRHPLPRPKQKKLIKGGVKPYDWQLGRYENFELKEYMKALVTITEECFNSVVSYNFPGLINILCPTTSEIIDTFIHINRFSIQEAPGHDWQLISKQSIAKDAKNPRIEVTISPEECPFDPYDFIKFSRTHLGGLDNVFTVSGNNPAFEPRSDDSLAEYSVIRKNVHVRLVDLFNERNDKIREKIKEILDNM